MNPLNASIGAMIARVERLSRGARREESTISRWVFGSGSKVKQLREGRGMGVHTLSRAARRLEELEEKFFASGDTQEPAP